MSRVSIDVKDDVKSLQMYGFNSLDKKIANYEIKELEIRREKAAAIELLNKRFFDFLMKIFYEYRENGISILFKNPEKELKLMDIMYERTYWITFDDKISGKQMTYLVHGYVSSCTILEIYEKIMTEVMPIYRNNKTIYERQKRLNQEIEKRDLKKNLEDTKAREKI